EARISNEPAGTGGLTSGWTILREPTAVHQTRVRALRRAHELREALRRFGPTGDVDDLPPDDGVRSVRRRERAFGLRTLGNGDREGDLDRVVTLDAVAGRLPELLPRPRLGPDEPYEGHDDERTRGDEDAEGTSARRTMPVAGRESVAHV